jgi:hypothetical protein
MSYTAVIDRANPTAFLFLIDQSRSMNEKMEAGETKAKFVGDALNKTLLQLIARCKSADGVQDYFDVGVLAYSGTGVHYGFGGALSASSLHPISSLAAHPLRIEERKKRVPDGTGGLVAQAIKFPVWIDSVSFGDTPVCEGFRQAVECLVSWCNSHAKSHPPTIIHVTGGPSTDGNPEQLAEAIRHLSTNHGQCLLFNLHVGSGGAAVIFPASEAGLPDTYSKMLFRMSSLFPTYLGEPAHEKGYSASSKSRFFGYQARYEDLVNFFEIGTRISNLLLKESPQSSARPTGSVTSNESDRVKLWPAQRAQPAEAVNPEPVEPAKPGPAKAAKPQPEAAASRNAIRGQGFGWPRGVRILGLAVAVITAIVVFKLFGTGRGPQLTQFSNQTPTTSSKVDSAAERQTSDNGRLIGLSAAPNVPTAGANSDRGAALLPDATKTSPPAENGSKLAAGSEQTTKPASMSPPKAIDQPNVADTSSANPSSAMVEKNTTNSSAVAEKSAANPSSAAANLDLGKVPDAKRVQQRLIELGYLSGVSDGVWGANSKRALAEFRTTEKLGQDDHWDPGTEKKLFSTSTAIRQQSLAFTGSWSKDASSCVDAPIKITASRAKSRDATCELKSIHQESEGKWRVQALCQLASSLRTEDTENSWTSNIELTLDDRRLTWESEKGSENYYRCSQ